MANSQLARPVVDYLRSLELELKQMSGVHPEEALSDAREYLANCVHELQEHNVHEDEELTSLLVERFGSPQEVAGQYGEVADKGWEREGYAPGWRICCCTCGRSKPAEKSGVVRIMASSSEKYVGGFCSHCRWFRWLRLIKDMDQTNLTDQLCLNLPALETLHRANRPWRLVFMIVGGVLAINALVWIVLLQFVTFE